MVKLYTKCGKPGWAVIVPGYNLYVLTEIAGVEWYWFLVCFAPVVLSLIGNSVVSGLGSLISVFGEIVVCYNLAKKFHKDSTTGILWGIFSEIMLPIVGYSKSLVYDASVPVSKNGFFDKDKIVVPNSQGPMGGYQQPMQGMPQQPMGGYQTPNYSGQQVSMGEQSGNMNQPTDNNMNNYQ
jgi:hypothetical protein